MTYLRFLLAEVAGVARWNGIWMAWNLFLAAVPAVLAVALFARSPVLRDRKRSVTWWAGVGLFVLFLPNAPYVVTDLIHLRADVAAAPFDGVVVFGVLPMYAAFIGAGFLAYVACTELVLREVRTVRSGVARWQVELPLHAVCAVGVVLGRITRLNSWEMATAPLGTLERIWSTLTWKGAPFAVAVLFIAIWGTHLVVRLLGACAARTAVKARQQAQLLGRWALS